MEKQEIQITLEEYKQLRTTAEAYQKLLGEYNLLAFAYEQMLPPKEEEVKVKKKIGFKI